MAKDNDKEVLKSYISFRKQDNPAPAEIEGAAGNSSVMLDSNYIKQSSNLISDALQKGFDVLQMSNGEIVTTGTKTVVYKYTWDEESGKMKRTSVTTKNSESEELEAEESIVVEALEGAE